MKTLLLLGLLIIPAQATPPAESVSILTFNIYGVVPWLASTPELDAALVTHYRVIGEEFARLRREHRAPQIVVLQEMFHPFSDAVFALAGYPYVAQGPGARLPRKPGRSGLVIMSEFPLADVQTMDYPECTGWDCLANKGVVTARVLVPGLPAGLQIYTTHMNADESGASLEDSKAARLAQTRRLGPFIERTRNASAPVVFAGDFNFRVGDADYSMLAGFPGMKNAAEECGRSRACTGEPDPTGMWKQAIDHQFYQPAPAQGVLTPAHLEQTFRDVGGKPPSDHLGVEVRYLFK